MTKTTTKAAMSDADRGIDPETHEGAETGLFAHLIELRARLIRAIAGLGIVFIALLPFATRLYEWIASPLLALLPKGSLLVARGVTSPFMAPLKMSFFVAALITAPWLLYQAWAFVAPGLYKREKRLALPLLLSALLLFYGGCAFAYFLVLPSVFGFLVKFSSNIIAVTPDPQEYLDFVSVLFLAFGTSFELPVALVILVLLGWVTPRQLSEWRGYAVVGIFIVAAVITPPDIFSQLLLAIPMCLLYEAGILAAKLVSRKSDG
jgi:sec-independent protein translocase protein TatC